MSPTQLFVLIILGNIIGNILYDIIGFLISNQGGDDE